MKTLLRGMFDRQVELQQRRIDRTAVTGQQALWAARWLRWNGTTLVGDLLP